MSTQFTNRQWRLPNNENKDKQSNYSMDFDGSSSYVDGGTGLGDDLGTYTGDLTISFWINRPTAADSKGILYFGSFSNARGVLEIYADTSSITILSGGNKVLSYTNANTWDNICIIYKSGDISNSKIYLNGSEQSTTDSGSFSSSLIFTGKKTIIGGYYNSAYTFNGKIDGVAIFDYALPATGTNSVATLYGSSSTGIGNPMSLSPAPVAYYPLGDQDAFNGANYLVPNSSLKDYVFDFVRTTISIGDNIDISGYTGLNNASAFTISVWFKGHSFTTDYIFSTSIATDYANNAIGLYLSSNQLKTNVYFGGVNSGISNVSIDLNKWYHAAITFDGSTGTATTYVNATAYVGSGNLGTTSPNFDTNLMISGLEYAAGSTAYYFDGEISNFQVFNSALPATGSNSIETLYNNGSPLTSMSGFTSLQGWWKLDASATYDGTDWTIPDDSSNSNDGTSSGMTQSALQQSDLSFKTSYSPYALSFDGTDDYINCGNDSSLVPNSLTISLWFKTSGSASAIPRLLNKSYGGSPYDSYFIRINNGVLNFKIGVSSASVQIAGTTNVVDGNWHNVIGTYDGSQLKLYLDGNSEATPVSETRAIIENTSYNLTLGCEFGAYGFSWPFTGSLSNVSVWNTALTSAQVTEIYNEGVPSNLNNHSAVSSLVSWWQLGSNSSFNTNWTVLDEKGSNNGTSVNMTEADIVDGVGSYANGLSSGMGGDEVIGDAPYSTANSLSVNMDVEDRTTDTPS